MTGIRSRLLAGEWAIAPRQLTENVELAALAFGRLQQGLCLGGMGSNPRGAATWIWEHLVGRRLQVGKDRLA